MAEKKIIDVSQFNGHIVWSMVKPHVDGVIIRAGYRGYGKAGTLNADPMFKANITGAIKAGVPVGVYWCSQAISDTEALAEARYLHDLLKDYDLTYPVYLDSEHMGPGASGRADKLGKARRTQYGKTFCKAMRDYGYTMGLYCSESWYADEIDGAAFAREGFTIWLAKYASAKPRYAHDAWQYTDSGTVPGITGKVDLNRFYREFGKEDYREAVKNRFGFSEATMDYLAGYKYAEDLLKKLATKG